VFNKSFPRVLLAALFLGLSAMSPNAQQMSPWVKGGAPEQRKFPQCAASFERCAGASCQNYWEHWGSRGDCLTGECHVANAKCFEELLQAKTL
jgi:hypothetical protein